MKTYSNIAFLIVSTLAAGACKSSEAKDASATPCETGAPALTKQLDEANGIGVELVGDKAKEIEASKKALVGKRYAFKGCRFQTQGGDQIAFAGTADSPTSIDCIMAGKEDGVKAFRRSAMDLDMDKMKLDISGVLAVDGNRLKLTECKVKAYE